MEYFGIIKKTIMNGNYSNKSFESYFSFLEIGIKISFWGAGVVVQMVCPSLYIYIYIV